MTGIEIIFYCWLIMLADGSTYCQCSNEPGPPPLPPDAVVLQQYTEVRKDTDYPQTP